MIVTMMPSMDGLTIGHDDYVPSSRTKLKAGQIKDEVGHSREALAWVPGAEERFKIGSQALHSWIRDERRKAYSGLARAYAKRFQARTRAWSTSTHSRDQLVSRARDAAVDWDRFASEKNVPELDAAAVGKIFEETGLWSKVVLMGANQGDS